MEQIKYYTNQQNKAILPLGWRAPVPIQKDFLSNRHLSNRHGLKPVCSADSGTNFESGEIVCSEKSAKPNKKGFQHKAENP